MFLVVYIFVQLYFFVVESDIRRRNIKH